MLKSFNITFLERRKYQQINTQLILRRKIFIPFEIKLSTFQEDVTYNSIKNHEKAGFCLVPAKSNSILSNKPDPVLNIRFSRCKLRIHREIFSSVFKQTFTSIKTLSATKYDALNVNLLSLSHDACHGSARSALPGVSTNQNARQCHLLDSNVQNDKTRRK